MNILELFKRGGQVRKMQTAAGGPIKLYDTLWVDNWKNRLTSPTVVAKQLTKLTSKIPIKYLGGSKDNVRKEFWKQEPVFQHAVDSIANQYGISPESLKYRLDKEGFTDRLIQRRNATIKIGALRFEPRGYELLNNPNYGLAGTQIGLDDAKTYIDSGKVKLINENWDEQGPFKNEKGRMTYPVNPVTLNDGMGIVAAHLKYFRDEALLDFPNGSEYDLDRYANAYYNRGAYGGKKWVLAGAKGYNYRKKGGMLELLKNGSKIHIKEKNKGKFTSYCGGKVTDECILKGKNSSNPAIRKRATFAANARKWKHEKGGLLKFEEGGKNGAPSTKFLSKLWFKKAGNTINNIGNNIGDFLKTDTGKGIMDIGLNILSGYTNYKKASNLLDSQVEQSKASLELAYLDTILLAILNRAIQQLLIKELWKEAYLNGETLDNYSDIVASHIGYDLYSNSLQNAELQKKQQLALLDLYARNAKGSMTGNLFGSVVLNGLGALGSVIGNKETSTPTLNFFNSPSIQTKNAMASPSYNFNTGTFNTKTIGGNLNFGVKSSFGTF